MVEMRTTWINDRWPLLLPEHRAARPVWDHWEAGRLASMWHHLASKTRGECDGCGGMVASTGGFVNAQNGEVVYDIGSEEGDFPALFSSWGCDVVLFEPNDRVWPNIKCIWEANDLRPPLAAFIGFAGPEDGSHPTQALREGWWPDAASGPVIHDHGFKNLAEKTVDDVITIDTMATLVKPPTAITIDCEGAELQVLQGARQTLLERRPKCWVSVHPDFMRDMYHDEPADLFAFMDELGYERTHICFDHESHEMFLPR